MADGLLLTHGAGSNRDAPLLVALDRAFAEAGLCVKRINLPFREARPSGPPRPADGERDRAGIARALEELRATVSGRLFAGGHSYGGRQISMLASENAGVADGLLLLSYPLHPPTKPSQLRTAHLPGLRTPAFFVHGTRDPFGSIEEIDGLMDLIPARMGVIPVKGAGHDLRPVLKNPGAVVEEFLRFFA